MKTIGNYYNLKCPSCDYNNSYIIKNEKIPLKEIHILFKNCIKCKIKLELRVSWELYIEAEIYPGEYTKITQKYI